MYFRSGVNTRKPSKMTHPMALGRIFVLRRFACTTNLLGFLLAKTPLWRFALFDGLRRRSSPASSFTKWMARISREQFDLESPNSMDIHADLFYGRTGYDIISYFRSAFIEVRKKMTENTAFDGFGSIFCGAEFFFCHTGWWASC